MSSIRVTFGTATVTLDTVAELDIGSADDPVYEVAYSPSQAVTALTSVLATLGVMSDPNVARAVRDLSFAVPDRANLR